MPRSRTNVRVRWLWSKKPVAVAMSAPRANDADAFVVLDKVKSKVRGQGAVVCNCSAPTHLRDNLLAMPVWYL